MNEIEKEVSESKVQPNGEGTETKIDGMTLTGNFLDGNVNGYGTMKHNGITYSGFFKESIFHGKGKYKNEGTGESYWGTYQSGVFHGQGEHILHNKEKYVGTFVNGERHGKGTWTKNIDDSDSPVYRG